MSILTADDRALLREAFRAAHKRGWTRCRTDEDSPESGSRYWCDDRNTHIELDSNGWLKTPISEVECVTVDLAVDVLVAVGVLPDKLRSEPETPEEYLVWSHDAQAWWGPNGSRYYGDDRQAGRYTRKAAEEACRMRTWEGKTPPEVMVLRPSAAVMASADAEKVLNQLIRAETKRRIAEREAAAAVTA